MNRKWDTIRIKIWGWEEENGIEEGSDERDDIFTNCIGKEGE